MEISVRELKNHLSEYLRRAEAGERIVVTSRGKPLASLTRATVTGSPSSDEETLQMLRRMPWLIPAKAPGRAIGCLEPVDVQEGTAAEIMDWVRGR